ncbi:glycosyl hydrolase family 8 [Andreprevotia chitinilytica]|uniref:glycosyl hydrolase family 8 n=1 Tax=Andreprevotia chitinilytica TaxID=396808 RepID=UPI00068F5B96|nr:glycosyl hydrolase family 8 [Andreprevotia chitinilytica]
MRLVANASALLLIASLTACSASDSSDTPTKPVDRARRVASMKPQPYQDGVIQPNHLSPAELDRQLLAFYQQWKSRYVAQDCGDKRYFVKVDADGKPVGGDTAPGTITVSEAHGYGMLLSVLMAAQDDAAQSVFDGMFRYFKDHPARSSSGLMAWNQVAGCGNSGGRFRGYISATDGDLDIAYALLLADTTWGSKGEINYRAEAEKVLAAILRHEVSPADDHLMIGDWPGTDGDPVMKATTRSSDFMLSHLAAFYQVTSESRWLSIKNRTYAIIDQIRLRYSPDTALMPDFISGLDSAPRPAPAGLVGDERDGFYSWNAARYPWRVALDYLLYGDARAYNALAPLNAWARRTTGDDPTRFADTYKLDGSPLPGGDTNALAYVSALGVSAMIDRSNQVWLNTIWDDLVTKRIDDQDYYGNTLKLLAMVTMTGHWKRPGNRPG